MSTPPALESSSSGGKWNQGDLIIFLIILTVLAGLGHGLNKVLTSLDQLFGSGGSKDSSNDDKKQTTPKDPKNQQSLPDLNVAIEDLHSAAKARGVSAEVTL